MKRILTMLVMVVAVSVTAFGQKYPTYEWSKADPATKGYDATKLREARKMIIKEMKTTGMMVIVGGDVIFQFGDVTRLSYIASCRKSVLAMLLGKYVENGTIDLNATMGQLGVDDIGGLLPIEKKARYYDLVTARSGVYHDASNGGDDADSRPERGSKKPGKYFLYNNWDFNVAGALFEQLTHQSIYEALRNDIARPIRMQDYSLDAQRKSGDLTRSKYPAYHIYLSTRDMARLGYLMLRNGKWEDKQVISENWAKRITSVVTPLEEMNPVSRKNIFEYGYMWWIFKLDNPIFEGAYTARGAKGQYITIIPKLDMVVAHKTDSVYERSTTWNQYFKLLNLIVSAHIDE